MLRKTSSLLKKQKNSEARATASQNPRISSPQGKLSKMLSASGRIDLVSLRKIAQENDKEVFIRFLRQPVLAGSAIQPGSISSQEGSGINEMNRTQIFEPGDTDPDVSPPSEALKHAIYPLVKGEYSNSASKFFTIGRVDGNDMIIPDFAISKKHAVITIDNTKFYIKDLDSTNGTMVNGTRLDKKPIKIHDKDVLSFARYEFTFLFPASLYKMLRA